MLGRVVGRRCDGRTRGVATDLKEGYGVDLHVRARFAATLPRPLLERRLCLGQPGLGTGLWKPLLFELLQPQAHVGLKATRKVNTTPRDTQTRHVARQVQPTAPQVSDTTTHTPRANFPDSHDKSRHRNRDPDA